MFIVIGIALQLYSSGCLLILVYTLASGSTQGGVSPSLVARRRCTMLLSYLCNDPIHGATMTAGVANVLPAPLLSQLKDLAPADDASADGFVTIFDQEHKTPEMIWNSRSRSYVDL